MARARVISRLGCPLHLWTDGPEGAPWVVFTHGVLMDHDLFAPQLEALAGEFRVLSWDVRGHGRSRPLGAPFTIDRVAEDLLAIMDELAIERAVLVGHSMGGFISQRVALTAPDRVAGLVALATVPLRAELPPLLLLGGPLSVLGFRLCPEVVIRRLVSLGAGRRTETRRQAVEAARPVTKGDFDHLWPALIRGLRSRRGERLSCPLLLVHGDGDHLVGFGAIKLLMRRWARDEPEARYEVIPAAGHNACRDNPECFYRFLLGFLRSLNL